MKTSSTGDATNKYKQMESVLPLYVELGSIRSLHPATFPVQLPSEYIQSMSDTGDIVIEPFCGSGTTLIACEQLNRKCYAMELEPKYVDVIIDRWEKLTGEKAVLLNGNNEAIKTA
jgi:DNA modification methylase